MTLVFNGPLPRVLKVNGEVLASGLVRNCGPGRNVTRFCFHQVRAYLNLRCKIASVYVKQGSHYLLLYNGIVSLLVRNYQNCISYSFSSDMSVSNYENMKL